jgi:hypothetical protein
MINNKKTRSCDHYLIFFGDRHKIAAKKKLTQLSRIFTEKSWNATDSNGVLPLRVGNAQHKKILISYAHIILNQQITANCPPKHNSTRNKDEKIKL